MTKTVCVCVTQIVVLPKEYFGFFAVRMAPVIRIVIVINFTMRTPYKEPLSLN